ncbi:hypothetical protein AURDEDRAFT_173571 [Auricularia subglabra TFB-10046 SS5]|nr:hypothetical protein AURDEDRAFT_173571 [Auricularia subglabra TFB-10046 SS5]
MPKLNAKQEAQANANSKSPAIMALDGVYWITASFSNYLDGDLRCFEVDKPVHASIVRNVPPGIPCLKWKLQSGSVRGAYLIKAVGVDAFLDVRDGKVVATSNGDYTEFYPTLNENGSVEIQLEEKTSIWTLLGDGNVREVGVEDATGSIVQKFSLTLFVDN